jgi:type IV secretory pathway TrbD component
LNIREVLRQTVSSIAAHKLRSFLTMFGIIWGITSVILLVGLGKGDPEQRDCGERELQRDPPQVNVALRTELGRARGEHARCEIQTLLSSEEQSLHDGTESQGRKIAQRHRRYQAHCE